MNPLHVEDTDIVWCHVDMFLVFGHCVSHQRNYYCYLDVYQKAGLNSGQCPITVPAK